MASLTFSPAVMDEIRAVMRQHRDKIKSHRELHDRGDCTTDPSDVGPSDQEATPCGIAQHVFEAWVQDLDEQILPEMDSEELRILHALLFGTGDDAFAVADELLKQALPA